MFVHEIGSEVVRNPYRQKVDVRGGFKAHRMTEFVTGDLANPEISSGIIFRQAVQEASLKDVLESDRRSGGIRPSKTTDIRASERFADEIEFDYTCRRLRLNLCDLLRRELSPITELDLVHTSLLELLRDGCLDLLHVGLKIFPLLVGEVLSVIEVHLQVLTV